MLLGDTFFSLSNAFRSEFSRLVIRDKPMTLMNHPEESNFAPVEKQWLLLSQVLNGQQWGQGDISVVGLHGWLDNSNSFCDLAPSLNNVTFTALDFPGHGLSPARVGHYYVWEYAVDVADWLVAQNRPAHIVGHSLGAGVALLTATLVPHLCRSLVFIDGFAPLPDDPKNFAHHFKEAYEARSASHVESSAFENWESLIHARMNSPVAPVSFQQSEALMARDVVDLQTTPLRLRHDPRLKRPSLIRLTPAQIASAAKEVKCPCLLVAGQKGLVSRKWEEMYNELLAGSFYRLNGNHHLHLGESSGPVSDIVNQWLLDTHKEHS